MTGEQITKAESITTTATYRAADVVAAFLAQLDRMPATVKAYGYNLRPFVAWLDGEGLTIDRVTPRDVLAYKRHLQETKKPATISAYLTAVRRLYAWVERETGYPNPARNVEGSRGLNKGRTSKAHDVLTHSQARAVASHEEAGLAGLRNRAMVNLMLVDALRTIEVVRLNVADYRQMGTAKVIAIQGKGHATADTVKVVDEHTAELLDAYLKARGDVAEDAPLFAATSNRNKGGRMTTRAINGIVKNTMRAEGIDSPRLTAHSLRHSAITYVVEAGADLMEAQTFARHQDPRTTRIYIHTHEALKGTCENHVAAVLAC